MTAQARRYQLALIRAYILCLLPAFSFAADKPNVLLICVDDLRPELNCFGMDYIKSPNIDKLAAQGRPFFQHYVNSPSCGPSRYTLLTGRYGPSGNSALFLRAKAMAKNPKAIHPSMPEWFRKHGYTTVSVGKVSHHPGGRGGKDWDDEAAIEMPGAWDRHLMPSGKWQHPRGIMHGLAHGEIRVKAGDMAVHQSTEGGDDIYPDGIIINESLKQLDLLTKDKKPFFLATGFIRPHLPFGAPAKYMPHYKDAKLPEIPHAKKPDHKTTWHKSGEFMKYKRWGKNPNTDPEFALEVRRHYAACVTYVDSMVGELMDKLEKTGVRDNTIILLWGDHGWHLGEHAIWGKHALFEKSLHSPLIITYPGIEHGGQKSSEIVETTDIFPTLCDLTGIQKPDFAVGHTLKPILEDPKAKRTDKEIDRIAMGYRKGNITIRNSRYRLIKHMKDGYIELYDHESSARESKNIAKDNPEVVERLLKALEKKSKLRSSF